MNEDSKIILVTGATGTQGGFVVRNLMKKKSFKVRGITRNLESAKALELQRIGVELCEANMLNESSLKDACKGVHGVFSVQDYWEKGATALHEVEQGLNLISAAKSAGVRHFVQSSMADGNHGDEVLHFKTKLLISKIAFASGLNTTEIGTVWFMNNLFDSKKGGNLTFPALSGSLSKDCIFRMLDANDIGRVVASVFEKGSEFFGKKLNLCGDALTVPDMARIFSNVTGKNPPFWKLPKSLLKLFNKDFAEQLHWENTSGWNFDVLKNVAGCELTSLKTFLNSTRER
jgi:uncharacterized protein YbjT (DUF2867 family)